MTSKGKCVGHDTLIFIMLYLILLTLWFHKFFFSTTCLWNTYEQLLTWICYCVPIKNKFQPVILTFYFGLVPQFYFLKWNRFLSTFIPVLCEHVTTLTTYYHGKRVLIYKLKDFRSWNFDTKLECTGVMVSKVTILESIH